MPVGGFLQYTVHCQCLPAENCFANSLRLSQGAQAEAHCSPLPPLADATGFSNAMIKPDDVPPQLQTQASFALGLDLALDNPELNPSLSRIESEGPSGIQGSISQAASYPKEWSWRRVFIATLLTSMYFDMVIGILVMVNIGLIVHQTNQSGLGMPSDSSIDLANVVFLILYTVEALLRLYAFRCDFFRSYWNLLDAFILASDWSLQIINWTVTGDAIPDSDFFKALRVIRALRVLRSIRTLHLFRELYIMLYGFLNALKAIGWAAVLLFLGERRKLEHWCWDAVFVQTESTSLIRNFRV